MLVEENNTYPKKEKLKSKKRISALFVSGRVMSVYPIKLLYLKTDTSAPSIKAGVAVPKKNFKSAVSRNHIKRLLRESYRLNKGLINNNTAGEFSLLFLYLGKDKFSFHELEPKMKVLLTKFSAELHKKSK